MRFGKVLTDYKFKDKIGREFEKETKGKGKLLLSTRPRFRHFAWQDVGLKIRLRNMTSFHESRTPFEGQNSNKRDRRRSATTRSSSIDRIILRDRIKIDFKCESRGFFFLLLLLITHQKCRSVQKFKNRKRPPRSNHPKLLFRNILFVLTPKTKHSKRNYYYYNSF